MTTVKLASELQSYLTTKMVWVMRQIVNVNARKTFPFIFHITLVLAMLKWTE